MKGRRYPMYESYENLKIKEKAGIETAIQELKYRKQHMETLPLSGLNNSEICMVQTEEIKKILDSIDDLYKNVSSTHKVRDIILLDAFHSATIEGARTTVEKVRKTFDQPKTKDDRMVINTVYGINYAYENLITSINIRELWDKVTKDVCENINLAGDLYRSGMVYVGNQTDIIHVPAKPDQIENMMEELFLFIQNVRLNIWLKACVVHFYFVYIHPFCDGNGRMARILTQSFLFHEGYEKVKYLALSRTINQNLSGYYSTLRESEAIQQNGKHRLDITPFISYMLQCMEECLISSIREEASFSKNQRRLLIKMKKRGKGTEIGIETASEILQVSKQTAGKALNRLVSMGYLDQIKRNRKNIYIMK